jgi:hypothetical protein
MVAVGFDLAPPFGASGADRTALSGDEHY